MKIDIRLDDLRGSEIARLLHEHLHSMTLYSPPESIHALDLDALRQPEITFWSVWQGTELMGCGAIKQLDAGHGEIKSMHTAEAHRGRGVGDALLRHLIDEARGMGLTRLSLETGSWPYFAPAHRLYERHGFRDCPPFADYVEDPNSRFMSREI